jgi:hypothetical protein
MRVVWCALGVMLVGGAGHLHAADIYVTAGAPAGGDGSKAHPFSLLAQAESASGPGDRIYVSAKSVWDVLAGPITLKAGQKLTGLASSGEPPRYEAEMPRLTSSVIDEAIYDLPYNNGAYRPTTAIVKLASGVEVSGLHFVDMKGPALLGADIDITGARIHDNTFSGVMEKSKSLIYSIVLGGAANARDVRLTDNVFRDGVTLGGITVQQRGDRAGEYYFQRNHFTNLGARAYFIHSEDASQVDTTILDSDANNIGVEPDTKNVPGAGNADSIIPYLVGHSRQRMLVKNFHYKNDKQVGGISNTAIEIFLYGMRREEDRPNWCSGCRVDIEVQDSVFERPSTDGIQIANYGNASQINLSIRRSKIIGAAPRQTLGAVSMMAQREGNKGSKINLLIEDSELIGSKTFAFANTNDSGEEVAVIDMGGGPLGSKGRNTIAGAQQGTFKLQGEKVIAKNNWWGGVTPTVKLIGSGGGADTSSPLMRPPTP